MTISDIAAAGDKLAAALTEHDEATKTWEAARAAAEETVAAATREVDGAFERIQRTAEAVEAAQGELNSAKIAQATAQLEAATS